MIHAGSAARATAMVAATSSLLFSGCGSTTATSVASVQGTTISLADVAHWTRIKRLELQNSRASASPSRSAQPETKALVFLITADWLQEESRAHGIKLPSPEVEVTYRHLLNGPSGQSFASSLRSRGMSRSDELLVLRLQELSNKLEAKVGEDHYSVSAAQIAAYYSAHASEFRGRGHPRQTVAAATPAIRRTLLEAQRKRRVAAFAAAFRQRWKQRTSCRSGYVVPECRNGPALSSLPG